MGAPLTGLLASYGDYYLAFGGVDSLTDLGLAALGASRGEVKGLSAEPSPSGRVLSEELGLQAQDRVRWLETFEENFDAWCRVPISSRAAYLNSLLMFARIRVQIVLTGHPMSWDSWREHGLRIDEQVLRQLIVCSISEVRCSLREVAPASPDDLMLGMDLHRARVLLEGRNAAMAAAIDRDALPGTTFVLVGAAHLPDFSSRAHHVTGLLELMRRRGYIATAIH